MALDDLARVTVTADTRSPGSGCGWSSSLAYGWSSQRSVPAVRDQADAALAAARHTGWDGLLAEQRTYLTSSGSAPTSSSTETPKLQQAVRFALFHVLQAGARASSARSPPRG